MPPSFWDQALQPGGSGYFSAPSDQLDPNLFDGQQLRHEVRADLLGKLAAGLGGYLDLRGADEWVNAFLAGSGITYQWDADRGNGDLDVLFGVDMPAFVRYNPDYQGIPERDVADYADAELKRKYWPVTARTTFGSQVYEVTFFWAPGVGHDITKIHPYAAYDLKSDVWVVRPPDLPHDPHVLYSPEWFDAAKADTDTAKTLAKRHKVLSERLGAAAPGSPGEVNARTQMGNVVASASALFADIHGGRKEAFGEQGHGYGDWANFRWQHAKQMGVVATIKAITAAGPAAKDSLYGGPISGAQAILTRDILRYGKGP